MQLSELAQFRVKELGQCCPYMAGHDLNQLLFIKHIHGFRRSEANSYVLNLYSKVTQSGQTDLVHIESERLEGNLEGAFLGCLRRIGPDVGQLHHQLESHRK